MNLKKETSGGIKNEKPKTVGANPLQISEGDASRLIGGIVEKGFSDFPLIGPVGPSSTPRPTVLPFPIARHRSHGPHWDPNVGNSFANTDNVDDHAEEDEDSDDMEVAVGFAKPLERKEKKVVDFSPWKDITKNEICSTGLEAGRKAKRIHSDKLSRKITEPNDNISRTEGVLSQNKNIFEPRQQTVNDIATKSKDTNMVENAPTWRKFIGGEKESVESQIDAENRARLAKMSPDEIAKKQSELMSKLNPALLSALKKRGESKLKRQTFSSSDVTGGEAENTQHEKNMSKSAAISEKSVKLVTGDAPEDKDYQNISSENRSMWDAWSKRVEDVRDMRFSLDGLIISSESHTGGYTANNVTERDFIRTEGDPSAAGYTIKEALALSRSVVPGQRTLALHLIAAVLDRSIGGICHNEVDYSSVDWEAIWAFALGPEPELALALRMSLDDNHKSVVLACAKAIQCALSCYMNNVIYDIIEKMPTHAREVCMAPVFRTKPDVHAGFLRGGFWKYNTKPSNIRSFGEEPKGENDENERTIRDDVIVAGQDFAAGLVRMGILPRICHLLETDPSAPLEECLISILIAIARHSPTCAAAILDCERLIPIIVNRFAMNDQTEINLCKIKSVTLLKVLARVEKKNCSSFVNKGILQKVTWHLYRYPFSLDQWVISGKNACKLSSDLLVEQLRLWKVVITYGYCISEFSNLFTSLCIWLSVPTFENLIVNDIIDEYCAVTREAYLLLDVLAGRLPNFYSSMHEKTDRDEKPCSWIFFGSIVDLALEWIKLKSIPHVSKLLYGEKNRDSDLNSLLWVISSVLNMFTSLLKAVTSVDITSFPNSLLPWLPEFVPKIGLEIIKNGYLRYHLSENGSLIEYLSRLRTKNRRELGLSCTCCLQGLVQVVDYVDKLIRHANLDIFKSPSAYVGLEKEDRVLANGILKSCVDEVRYSLTRLMKLITKEWQLMRPVEVFHRGGPAPGVGLGWGASGGGYWALDNLLAQQDASFLVYMLEIAEIPFTSNPSEATQMLNFALAACLVVGPGNYTPVVGKLFNFIFRVPVLKYIGSGIQKFVSSRSGYKSHTLSFEEDEYVSFANILGTHFRNRWLSVKKKKSKSTGEKNTDASREESPSLRVEWARQRLPLPAHWILSAISTVYSEKPSDFFEVAKGGLFFLLGLEALSSPSVECVPVVWKLHAMSVILLSGMEILGDEKCRGVYEILQDVYGKIVDEVKCALSFGKEINENYATFVEALVEQFAAESYGDLLFGRQVAMYLHKSVEAPVRLAVWNALSNARALELLPTVDKCFTKAEDFLEPVEDNERMLEAYVKSWVSGALDKAANRSSVTFVLVLHHLSSFIFGDVSGDMLSLRNKLVKSLLRDYSRKHQHQGIMVKLICHTEPNSTLQPISEIEKRLQLLKEICNGLGTEVEKLGSCIRNEFN